jgi:hypothetical protein
MNDNGFARAAWAYENQSPPEPVECCDEWEDPDHDSEQCLDEQREAAAEAKAERMREGW